MPNSPVKLTYECIEHLHTWIQANCPCALENEEFLPGLHVIVENEVESALQRQQARLFQHLQATSPQ